MFSHVTDCLILNRFLISLSVEEAFIQYMYMYITAQGNSFVLLTSWGQNAGSAIRTACLEQIGLKALLKGQQWQLGNAEAWTPDRKYQWAPENMNSYSIHSNTGIAYKAMYKNTPSLWGPFTDIMLIKLLINSMPTP